MRILVLALTLITAGCGLLPAAQGGAVAHTDLFAPASAVIRHWTGSYVYENPLGEIPAGSGHHAFVTYRLRITKSAPLPATLTMDGFQTEEKLRCAISGDDEQIEIRFVSYADGRVVNRFGVAVYEPNALLFTLDRVPQGGQQGLITEWKALKPDRVSKERGSYLLPVARLGTHTRK